MSSRHVTQGAEAGRRAALIRRGVPHFNLGNNRHLLLLMLCFLALLVALWMLYVLAYCAQLFML